VKVSGPSLVDIRAHKTRDIEAVAKRAWGESALENALLAAGYVDIRSIDWPRRAYGLKHRRYVAGGGYRRTAASIFGEDG